MNVEGSWTGNIRWGRNEIISCGDVRDNRVSVGRTINGASGWFSSSSFSDVALAWNIARAERFLQFSNERPDDVYDGDYASEPFKVPEIWFESSFNLLAKQRATIADSLITPAEKKGMLASGYIQVSGHGHSRLSPASDPIFLRYTLAQLSVTVRDPRGLGSGWAGIDWNDWNRVDGKKLTAIAIDKCLRSRNPVAIEPGRYNTVLEPQAVHDFGKHCFTKEILDRQYAERFPSTNSPYAGVAPGTSKIGLKLFDERISITHDPMDRNCSFPPIGTNGERYNRAVWIENGVLKNLAHTRGYAISRLGLNSGLESSSAYSMSGGEMPIEEMIERTERGLLITRFSSVGEVDRRSLLLTGYTRDGLWLIERGKVSKAVKNLRFTETPFHTFNNIVELGVPQRVFSPESPAVVPAIMSRDFSFTATIEAI